MATDRAARIFYWACATGAGVAMLIGVNAPWAACVAVVAAFVAEVTSNRILKRDASDGRLGALEGHQADAERAAKEAREQIEALEKRLVRVENRTGARG